MPGELDVVTLLTPVEGYPAGTVGTVLAVEPERRMLLLEIVSPDGASVATPSVPANCVRLSWSSTAGNPRSA